MYKIKYDDIDSIEFVYLPNFTQDYGWDYYDHSYPLKNIPTKNKKNIYVITPTNYENIYPKGYQPHYIMKFNNNYIKGYQTLNLYGYISLVRNKYFTVRTSNPDGNNYLQVLSAQYSYGAKITTTSAPNNDSATIISDKDHNLILCSYWESNNSLTTQEKESIYHKSSLQGAKISTYSNKQWKTSLDKDSYPFHIVIYLKEEQEKYTLFKKR